MFFLLRSFFPSWKFFDDIGPELSLEIRLDSHEEWKNCLPPISRSIRSLFLNPESNYLHACHNLLNHLSVDISELDTEDPKKVAALTTYKVVKNLARFQIKKLSLAATPYSYQFRLCARLNDGTLEQILVSPVYED
jgi:hypothetical protein